MNEDKEGVYIILILMLLAMLIVLYFIKVFWNTKTLENFKRRCSYSKRVRIISIKDNSKFYD